MISLCKNGVRTIPTFTADGRRFCNYTVDTVEELLRSNRIVVQRNRRGAVLAGVFRQPDGGTPVLKLPHTGTASSIWKRVGSVRLWQHKRISTKALGVVAPSATTTSTGLDSRAHPDSARVDRYSTPLNETWMTTKQLSTHLGVNEREAELLANALLRGIEPLDRRRRDRETNDNRRTNRPLYSQRSRRRHTRAVL